MNTPSAPLEVRTSDPDSSIMPPHPADGSAVLCVDSDPEMLPIVRHALRGYEVTFRSSAYDALRTVNGRAFDLYILEYWQPDWSGPSLCRELRRADPHVPVCFCTSADRTQMEQRAARAGASQYIIKPVDPAVLSGEVARLMQARAFRAHRARSAATSVLHEELGKRFASLPAGVIPQQLLTALTRVGRRRAQEAYVTAGGTLSDFDRVWAALWHDTLKAHLQ